MYNLVLKNLSKWSRLMTDIIGFEELIKYIDPSFKLYTNEIKKELNDFGLNEFVLNEYLTYLISFLIKEKLKSDKLPNRVLNKTNHKQPIEALRNNLIRKLLCEKLNESPNENYDSKCKRLRRGQYRKYESDQMNKAVGAVLNGEMTVHKAGSRYGIPQSTLEYKVKERTVFQQKTINY